MKDEKAFYEEVEACGKILLAAKKDVARYKNGEINVSVLKCKLIGHMVEHIIVLKEFDKIKKWTRLVSTEVDRLLRVGGDISVISFLFCTAYDKYEDYLKYQVSYVR